MLSSRKLKSNRRKLPIPKPAYFRYHLHIRTDHMEHGFRSARKPGFIRP